MTSASEAAVLSRHPNTLPPRHPRTLFDPAPGIVYLDAATYGLPPRPSVEALERALRRWQSGEADWVEEWDRQGEACRAHFAALIGGDAAEIALVPTVSAGVGLVAASLPEGIELVVADDEFPSVLFPLLVAERERNIRIRRVAFADLAEAIGPGTGLVAFSLTRSQDGESAPLGDMVAAARRHGTQILVDATHAIPFVPVQPWIAEIDCLVCHGYKHLLCPRGVGFLHLRRERWAAVRPWFANWRTGTDLYENEYGGSLDDLARNARRFDVSLAWHAWAGAEPALALLREWQAGGLLEEVKTLARRLAAGIGRPEPSASIVSLRVEDAEEATRSLAEMGVRCAARGGNIRLSPHIYNTEADIDRAIAALAPFVA
ncbi:MAG: cysteine desulfurase [Thermomicrobiales bacterium]|nr:cysteine desulfurase [Thermomicrobiales bacterium]